MAMADYGGPTVKSTHLYSSGLFGLNSLWLFLGAFQPPNDQKKSNHLKEMGDGSLLEGKVSIHLDVFQK